MIRNRFGYELFRVPTELAEAIRGAEVLEAHAALNLGYISRHREGINAAGELREIALALIDEGWQIRGYGQFLRIKNSDAADLVVIDLFHLAHNDAPFGELGVPTASLVNALLIHDGSLRTEMVEEIYWANFYSHTENNTGSTFCQLINATNDMPHYVVDIGCGDGRDSYAFGRAGRQVLGLDRSHIGIRHATEKADERGLSQHVRFIVSDVSDKIHLRNLFGTVLETANGHPVLFYARFFLHSISSDVQEGLMTGISTAARTGDVFAAEFRTTEDRNRSKVYAGHYRRFQDGQEFGIKLDGAYGFERLMEQQGAGLSPYKGEDPVLYRVIARKR